MPRAVARLEFSDEDLKRMGLSEALYAGVIGDKISKLDLKLYFVLNSLYAIQVSPFDFLKEESTERKNIWCVYSRIGNFHFQKMFTHETLLQNPELIKDCVEKVRVLKRGI